MRLAFLDIETTGLDVGKHEVWEVAYLLEDQGRDGVREQRIFQFYVSGRGADPEALKLNHFDERYNEKMTHTPSSNEKVRQIIADLSGAILIGNNVAFDAKFLREKLGCEPWNYHVVDVKALVAGRLGIEPPWSSAEMYSLAGIDPVKRHEALDDCFKARALYHYAIHSKRVYDQEAPAPEFSWLTRPRAVVDSPQA